MRCSRRAADERTRGADFGDELDLQIGYKLNDRLRGDLFLASYDGGSGIADTDKLWLTLSMKL